MTAYLAVFAVAAAVTVLATPLVVRVSRRVGAVDVPGDPRKVHARSVPTMGGLAMLIGFLASLGVAWGIARSGSAIAGDTETGLRSVFTTSEPEGLVLGALLIALVGLIDDIRGLSPPAKLAGQIIAALVPVLHGIQLVYAWIPGAGILVLSPDLGVPLTVLVIVAMVNAVNFIDGLDGLAAGVVAIAAVAFFAYTVASAGVAASAPTSANLAAASLAGMCVGFLWHNFHPAKIFMGDTGSMLLGLLLASSGVAYVGRSTDPNPGDFVGSVPLFIPALVLAVPFVDTMFAVARRVYRKQPISAPDRGHLHHRLLHVGVGHRSAVLTLYFWSAVVAFGAVGGAFLPPTVLLIVVAVLLALGIALTLAGVHRARSARPATPTTAAPHRTSG